MIPKRFMIIAGETSGDILAAELVNELREGVGERVSSSQFADANLAPQFFGAGGPRMAEAGVKLAFDLTKHSVVGLTDVLKNYQKFKRLLDELVALALERQPDVIICVDFSGFNRRFAAAIRQRVWTAQGTFYNWSPKIVQYISPQVWASRESRIYQMQRDFDLVLTIFPFEKGWYAQRVPQLRVEFVGHPLIDRYAGLAPAQTSVESADAGQRVLLLPGSRRSELQLHLPVVLGAWKLIQEEMHGVVGTMVLPNDLLGGVARELIKRHQPDSNLTLQLGKLPAELAKADVAIASTGTVTMECAYFGVPTVTLYKTSWFTYQIGKRLIRVKSLTMPNLLADEPVFPEFIQDAATASAIANAALDLLKNSPRRTAIKHRLSQIVATLGKPGAAKRAANLILDLK